MNIDGSTETEKDVKSSIGPADEENDEESRIIRKGVNTNESREQSRLQLRETDTMDVNDGSIEGSNEGTVTREKINTDTLHTIDISELREPPVKVTPRTPTRGIKRSQGKSTLIKSCKRKKLSLSKQPSEGDDLSQGEEALADNECSDDSDSEGWHILEEESEGELEKALEENASRNKLTAYNVKTILHQVITNEHVVAMVRNTILNEVTSKDELKEAAYEPKMTRAKVKKAIEEKGDVMHPWPLTPLKKKEEHVKTILDIELSEEEEEDDDYNPEKEKEGSFSDEDSESVTSSQVSDLGSPCPSTPLTPRTPTSSLGSAADLHTTPTTEKEYKGPFLSPMGPPRLIPSYRQSLSKKFQEAEEMSERLREEQTIAARTRSKLSLEDTSIIDLESTFVPPDFTPDMYDTQCEDEDWQGFLQSLYKPPESENTNDGMDDEEKDPEYNYLAEVDDLIDSDEELRDDRAVKISKKEMNELMDELFDYYQETQPMEEEEKKVMKFKAKAHYKRQASEAEGQQSVENQSYVMSDNEREQIADQMRKHVQLLTQMYVSAMGNQSEYKEVADYSKNLLMELNQFSITNTQCITPHSLYNAANLPEAVQLVNKDMEWEQIERVKPNRKVQYISSEKSIASLLVQNYHTLSKQKKDLILNIVGDVHSKSVGDTLQSNKQCIPHFTSQQKQLIWTSPVFMYPELLPHGAFLFREDVDRSNRRVVFTESEDRLMVLGLDQFKHLPYFHQLIRKFLLPSKTEEQIRVRIKNMTSSKASQNIIKNFKLTKKLPEFPRFTGVFSSCDMMPPRDQPTEKLPTWCKELKIREILASSDEEVERRASIQRSSSVNLPVESAGKQMIDDSRSNSAPATPMTASQDPNPVQTLVVSPLLTPEKSSLSTVSSTSTPVLLTSGSTQDEALALNAILLTNKSLSLAGELSLSLSSTSGLTKSSSQALNLLSSPSVSYVGTQSLESPLTSSALPAVTSQLTNLVSVSSDHYVNELSKQTTTAPLLDSSQTVYVQTTAIQTHPGAIVTDSMESSQPFTTSSYQSMPIISCQKHTSSTSSSQSRNLPTTLPPLGDKPVTCGRAVSDLWSDGDTGTVSSSFESTPEVITSDIKRTSNSQTERCISPDTIEPTVKMKKTDSNDAENLKCSTNQSFKESHESLNKTKKVPFSPGFIPLHQESGQSELLGNPGSPILTRVMDSVSGGSTDKGKEKNLSVTETNSNQNAVVCESDFDTEQRENKGKTTSQSTVGNVFFSDNMIQDSSSFHSVSDNSHDTTLVASGNSSVSSPRPVEISTGTKTHSAAVGKATNVVSPRPVNNAGPSVNTPSTVQEKIQTSEHTQPQRLLAIPIENRFNVNKLTPTKLPVDHDQGNPNRSQLIGTMSSISSAQPKPVASGGSMKSALQIVAAYSSLIISPKRGPSKFAQKAQETTPVKSKYRPLAPKPCTSPAKAVSPYLTPRKSPRKSPRRQQLQKQARAICPKGLVVKMVISPSKKAASQIMNRVLGKTQCKILPRPPCVNRSNLQISPGGSLSSKSPASVKAAVDETETEEEGMETASECDTVESEYLSDEVLDDVSQQKKQSARKNLQKKFHKHREQRNSVESDDTEVEDPNLYDSQDDNEDDSEHLADLMAASTTIKFNPKTILSKDPKDLSSKTKRRKDATLAMLAPDIVDTDPQKDDRDTAFAQAYLTKAAEALKDDFTTYEQFLKLLYEFGRSEQSPVKLYKEMTVVLKNYPDLMEDFSAFLSPSQAVECGCFMENLRFRRARTFLRKLEVYAERHPSHYQKIMKILTRWSPGSREDDRALKESLEPVLKSQPHLLDDLSLFFEEEKPPDSYMTEFEEITLGDSDEEDGFKFDEFEEVVIPEDENPDGTKKCMCTCHQNPNAKNFHMRNIHCTNCCLKVIDGELYYRINRQVLKKVRVKYHPEGKPPPVPQDEEEECVTVKAEPMTPAQWGEEDEEVAEKENVQILPPKSVGIKLKISSKKKGKHGRFFSINEMAESPVKKITSSSTLATTADNQTSHSESLPSTSEPSEECSEVSEERESSSLLRRNDPESMVENSEGFQLSGGLPDLIPHQDQMRHEETSETNAGEQCVKIEETSPLSSVSKAVKVTVTADSNEDFAGAIISIPNTETPKKNSEKEFTISSWMETANLTPQKTAPSAVEEIAIDGHTSYVDCKDSTSSDLLAKAVREAMISHSDVSQSLDASQLGRNIHSMSSPSKSAASSSNQNLGFSLITEMNNQTSNSDTNISVSAKEQRQIITVTSPANTEKKKTGEKRRIVPKPVTEETSCVSPAFSMSSIDNMGFLKSPTDSNQIIAYTNSPVFYSDQSNPSPMPAVGKKVSPNPKALTTESRNRSVVCEESDPNRTQSLSKSVGSPSGAIISSVVGFGPGDESVTARASQETDGSQGARETTPSLQFAWTRDMDKVILESVKIHGPGSKTFEDISKGFPGSTAAQVIERFHTLLEMLADETPSEEDTTEETTESSS